ncbi:hypothetical protein GCM10010326_64450 [Streptomyces xanthochromogenes]|uniref:Uncharacterized protein n=1 Tax=Streptomyces xanthochromogenes TaxID=67384 RepID=A0ABQ3AL13_9ACTN|nr:hypothetical protein GCM10010326_64450 [Streptomyces xanthochromogenes]
MWAAPTGMRPVGAALLPAGAPRRAPGSRGCAAVGVTGGLGVTYRGAGNCASNRPRSEAENG